MDMPVTSTDKKIGYNEVTEELYRFFLNHLLECEPITLTHMQYSLGTDFLPEGQMKKLVALAYKMGQDTFHVAISPTNQMNIAFFRAANDLKKITVVG